jgi:hypothetical protein
MFPRCRYCTATLVPLQPSLLAQLILPPVFSVDGKFTALFEEHEHKWFVDRVLSWMDLNEFVRMMQRVSDSGSNLGRK